MNNMNYGPSKTEMKDIVEPTVETGTYSSRKDDPEYLLTFMKKYVKVQLIKNVSFNGFVDTIDPITYSIILYVPKEDNVQATLIPGHAVKDIIEMPPPLDIQPPNPRVSQAEPEQEISSRKAKLIAWFKCNLLPVTEMEDYIIIRSVKVLPPYTRSYVYAESPVVALQIRKLMERMPQDFNSK